jgi:hypothetical protein
LKFTKKRFFCFPNPPIQMNFEQNEVGTKKRKYVDIFDNNLKTKCQNCAIAHTECQKQEDDYCKRCLTLGLECQPVPDNFPLNNKTPEKKVKVEQNSENFPLNFERKNSLDFDSWSFLDDPETKKVNDSFLNFTRF